MINILHRSEFTARQRILTADCANAKTLLAKLPNIHKKFTFHAHFLLLYAYNHAKKTILHYLQSDSNYRK